LTKTIFANQFLSLRPINPYKKSMNPTLEVFAVMMTIMTGLVTGGWTIVKVTELIFGKKGLNKEEHNQLLEQVQRLLHENEQLKQRMENMETIVASLDTDLLESFVKLQAAQYPNLSEQKIRNLASQIKGEAENSKSSASETAKNAVNNQVIEENVRSIVNKLLLRLDKMLDAKK
jgi:phosphate uptake regulator